MKRCIDSTIALILILTLSPILLLIVILHLWIHGRPILFQQIRAGHHGKPFKIIKFRTMRDGTGSDKERLTPWGKFLRSTSLDELPELLNVLRGEMSLVGPRPLPTSYLPRYNSEQMKRHACRPGITGLAQINGRNDLSWERQFELDLWYINHRSFMLDFKILVLTPLSVIRMHGITEKGQATRTEFFGSNQCK